MVATKAMTMPKTIGATVDAIWKIAEQRKALSAKDTELHDIETLLKKHLAANFAKSELDGAQGKVGRVTIKRSTVAEVTDWAKFYAHIKKTGDWELLQRRPGTTAIRERWNNGKKIPGIEPKELETLAVTGLKK